MERKCQNCRHVDVCLKRSLAIFNMFIVTGRYNEVENAKKSLDVSVGCEHYEATQSPSLNESRARAALSLSWTQQSALPYTP